MGKTTSYANGLLALIFNATALADLAQNDGSSPATSLYISLHTASPGVAGSQTTSECAYTGYARVAVVRTSSGFAVSDDLVHPVGDIEFPQCTAGSEDATYFGIGVASSGAGTLLYFGALTPAIPIWAGETPIMPAESYVQET